jgi:Ca2+/Na+ antiporter
MFQCNNCSDPLSLAQPARTCCQQLAIRRGKAEMALGNIWGKLLFQYTGNTTADSALGEITVSISLVSFSLPVMAACGLLFYLLTQTKTISVWRVLCLSAFTFCS